MEENKKTIQVNREYLSFSKSTRKRQPKEISSRKRKEKPKTLQSAGKLRKEFMKKIKDFQKRQTESKNTEADKSDDGNSKEDKEFNDEFNKSLGFLQEVVASNKEKERRKSEKEKKDNNESLQIMLDIPKELEKTPKTGPIEGGGRPSIVNAPVKSKVTMPDNTQVFSSGPKNHKSTVKIGTLPRPPYSCLKGGNRPTYREWMRTQRRHSSESNKPQIKIENKPEVEETERSRKLNKLKKEKDKEKPKHRMIKSKRVTKTIKHKLGKIGRSVSVLIKSRETRKKIASERVTLNKTSLHEIKKYLREKNMIKSGTKAPNHVLRKMYEQCILAGDVCNKSADVLVHNYLNDI
jgi:hypothetical protein